VIIRGRRCRRIGDRGFWKRNSCVIYGVENVKRHRIGEIKKLRREEQKG